jgi:ribosomal protein L3 glutamine methyltransferase
VVTLNINKPMQSLQSITDLIRWGASRFSEAELCFGHGTDNAIDEAAALVLFALHLPPDLSDFWFSARLTDEERRTILALMQRRVEERIPLPYLTGEAWFAGLRFHVNQDVLIPRSPIAEFIETGFAPWIESSRISHLLDLCCGSGCIGLAAAIHLAECSVDLVDVSAAALKVAQQNLQEHGLEARVNLIRSDLFNSVQGRRYDVIVSNPPYVSRDELSRLPREYSYEPALALQAEEDGLAIVARIIRDAHAYLNPGGILIVEVGNNTARLMERYPEIEFIWLEFERGGEGVFMCTAEELGKFAGSFNSGS